MKIGIMQPYFLPYLGYFQLIALVDKFVILDDVNFIKKGFINRNSILLNNQAHRFSIPLIKPSQNKLINNTYLIHDQNELKKILNKINQAYARATHFKTVFPIVESIFLHNERNLSEFITFSISNICSYLDIETNIVPTSSIYAKNNLRGQERIMSIVKTENATHYINPIGGMDLYSKEVFEKNGVKLNFHSMGDVQYKQFNDEFIPFLSIIDTMMFNSPSEIKNMLSTYTLL